MTPEQESMSDLTKRLREMAGGNEAHYCYKAADRIEQLERDLAAAPAPAPAAPAPIAEVQTGTIRWHIDRDELENGTKLYAVVLAAPAPKGDPISGFRAYVNPTEPSSDVYGGDAINPAAPAPEPVAWMVYTQDGKSVFVTDNPTDIPPNCTALPLFTESKA